MANDIEPRLRKVELAQANHESRIEVLERKKEVDDKRRTAIVTAIIVAAVGTVFEYVRSLGILK